MCDTLYCSWSAVPAAVSAEASAAVDAAMAFPSFFGKNSDRHPEEPQSFCSVPRRPASPEAVLGGKIFPVKDEGLAFVLSKPSWMAGGEMGFNEKGVAIGNEAVFSRFKPAKDGVLGMDILRAALGAAATAKEAVDFICAFVERFDQGGQASYRGSLFYDNSFIVSDPRQAYILETAGRRWAWRAVSGYDSISNTYCIGEDYKRLDAQTRKEIAPVNERAACSDEADPGRKGEKESFKAHVENRFYLLFVKGEERRALSRSLLEDFATARGPAARGNVAREPTARGYAARPVLDFLSILRAHGPFDARHPWKRHMESLCMHPGGFPSSATTASFAAEYKSPEAAVLWFTGNSCPCVSLYKPMLWVKGEFLPLWMEYDYAEGAKGAEDYWQRWKKWLKKPGAFLKGGVAAFAKERDRAQAELSAIAEQALADIVAAEPALAAPRQKTGAIVAAWEKDIGL